MGRSSLAPLLTVFINCSGAGKWIRATAEVCVAAVFHRLYAVLIVQRHRRYDGKARVRREKSSQPWKAESLFLLFLYLSPLFLTLVTM